MNVQLVDRLPDEGDGRYVDYGHRRLDGAWRFRDLRAIVRRRQDSWLDDLDSWHRAVSEVANSAVPAWWLSPGSRLTAWYPLDLKPLFFALAALEEAEAAPDPLTVVGCPPEAAMYMRELSSPSVPIVPRSVVRRPHRAIMTSRALIAHARRGLFHGVAPRGRARVVAFSLVLDPKAFVTEGDHYFGAMLDGLGDDLAWIYYFDRLREIESVRAHLASMGRRAHLYFDWLGPTRLAATAWSTARAAFALDRLARRMPPLRIAGRTSRAFPFTFHDRAVRASALTTELAVHQALRRAFAELGPEAIVYPYEEKGIERALLLARDAAAPKARTVAFAHAVYNAGHVYARYRGRSRPAPDIIAATGDAAAQWFVRSAGVPPETVVAVGSPRHRPSPTLPPSPSWRERLRLLLVVGYGHEPGVLASYAEEVPDLLAGCDLLVRRYPYGWPEQSEGIARLRRSVPGLRDDGGALEDQIRWCDVVLFDSTSAGVHAMLRGRLSVSVALPDLYSGDPGADKGDLPGFIRCGDAHELSVALRRIRSLDEAGYLAEAGAQQRSAARIYSAPDPGRLATLLLG